MPNEPGRKTWTDADAKGCTQWQRGSTWLRTSQGEQHGCVYCDVRLFTESATLPGLYRCNGCGTLYDGRSDHESP